MKVRVYRVDGRLVGCEDDDNVGKKGKQDGGHFV